MSGDPVADQAWHAMSAVVFDNRDAWRRDVVDHTGLPFSRFRILRRVARKPMSCKAIAEAVTMDAPATTVAVNDLEDRGLVTRTLDPTNRRSKLVTITDAGREVLAVVAGIDDPAPAAFAALTPDEMATLRDLLGKLAAH